MYGYICSVCEGNFDAGELTNGKCDECREAEIQGNSRSEKPEQKWDRLVIKTKGQLCLAMEGGLANE